MLSLPFFFSFFPISKCLFYKINALWLGCFPLGGSRFCWVPGMIFLEATITSCYCSFSPVYLHPKLLFLGSSRYVDYNKIPFVSYRYTLLPLCISRAVRACVWVLEVFWRSTPEYTSVCGHAPCRSLLQPMQVRLPPTLSRARTCQ